MVYQEWNISFEMRSELFCEAFIIMPNHLHAILRINKGNSTDSKKLDGILEIVGTHGRVSLQESNHPNQTNGIAYRPPKSISSFVAGFKSTTTKRIN